MSHRWIALLFVGCLSACSSGPAVKQPPQDAVAGDRDVNQDLEEYVKKAGQIMQEEPETPRGFPLSAAVWPMNEIRIGWENPEPANLKQRNWVRDAVVGAWPAHGNIKLTGWEQADDKTNIRILIADTKKGAYTQGLGRQLDMVKDGMVLNFTFMKWRGFPVGFTGNPAMTAEQFQITTIAIHEFGHALGISHEHNREDATGDKKICPQGNDGDILVGKYDEESCMNYRNKKGGNHGKLSAGDIATIKFMYPSAMHASKAEGIFSGSGDVKTTDRAAKMQIELELTQDKTTVTGTALIHYEHATTAGGVTKTVVREALIGLKGWKVNFVAVLYSTGSATMISAWDKEGDAETRSLGLYGGTRTVNGAETTDLAAFNKMIQEMEFAKYLPAKIFGVFNPDGKTLRLDSSAGGIKFSFRGDAVATEEMKPLRDKFKVHQK